MIIKRLISKKLKSSAKQYPVVLVTGPRQSGKTTLCRYIFPNKPYVSLEDPDNRQFAKEDPKGFLERYSEGAVFDEIQRVPILLSYIQCIVDERKRNGLYILTGSQNLLLLNTVQQTLAGRVALLKLLPFSTSEITSKINKFSLEKILYTGFFPRLFDQKINPTSLMSNYVDTYVQRDVRDILDVKSLSLFQKFLKICAGRIGQILNLTSIGNDLGVSHSTIREWLSVLEASYIVYLLQPYYANIKKRLVRSPKIYFTDVGLACYLLGITNKDQVARDPLLGSLFENFVIMEIIKYYYANAQNPPISFFRDNVGNEVDLIIEKARNLIAIEIKAGKTFSADWFKGLDYIDSIKGCNVLARSIVYGGSGDYKRQGFNIFGFKNVTKLYDILGK